LDSKTDVDARDRRGYTVLKSALFYALQNKTTIDILPLLEAKADTNANSGWSCLSIAIHSAKGIGYDKVDVLVKQLLDAKADPNIGDSGESILGETILSGSHTYIQLLIDAGAVVNVITNRQTALHVAAFSSTECCKTLLRNGAYPSLAVRDSSNMTPLSRLANIMKHNILGTNPESRKRLGLLKYSAEACGMNVAELMC
jgi:ankyrin repeat protein